MHAYGYRLRFGHDETGRRTDFDGGRNHLCQAWLGSRRGTSVVRVRHGQKHLAENVPGVPTRGSNANEAIHRSLT